MFEGVTRQLANFVTTHNRLVVLLFVVLTAGVLAGVAQDAGGTEQGVDDDAIGDTEVYQASEYISERYGMDGDDENDTVATADVYVKADEGSVLSRDSLLTAIDYQLALKEEQEIADNLTADGMNGPPNMIATRLADRSDPSLSEQYDVLADADDEDVAAAAAAIFTGGDETRFYLPTSYETGTADAEAMRLTINIERPDAAGSAFVPDSMRETIYETAQAYDEPAIFTTGQFALADLNQEYLNDMLWLVVPPILLVLLIVLGFAYRDVTDVLIGFAGSVVALLWTFGLMGWLGLLSQQTALIVPVLIAALSIDFGFHVFMRYRERRNPEDGVRDALSRSTAAVAVAFLLVTVTAAIGFLTNLVSPVPMIRELGVAITLGVISALLIFTTLVPALKVSADGLWERFGFDRNKTALGKGRYLKHVLGGGAVAARRAAIPLLLVVVVVGIAGGLSFTELDRETFQQDELDDIPEWQTELPGPMAFDAHESETVEHYSYAQSQFQVDQDGFDPDSGGVGFTQMLVEGENGVATQDAMQAVATGHEAATQADDDVVLRQGEEVHVVSPLSAMQNLASEDEEFAATFEAADTTDDGVPDSDLEELYDEFYDAAPEQARQVLERTDDGSYESMLVMVPAQRLYGTDRAEVMHGIADEMAAASGHQVTAVGVGTVNDAEMGEIVDGVVWTLVIALAGVLLTLCIVYRLTRDSALLGAVTVLPIALALGLVFGGMYLLGQPLTLLTALLVSITIGLGIDYNIHISDRFAQELERGTDPDTALRESVTGTGGALLGSAVTSGGAFALLALVPDPQFTSFGVIVALALGASFLLSVFVLPSLLYLWARRASADPLTSETGAVVGSD